MRQIYLFIRSSTKLKSIAYELIYLARSNSISAKFQPRSVIRNLHSLVLTRNYTVEMKLFTAHVSRYAYA